MKSISLAVIIIGVLLLLGCQQDPEVLEGQAAQALEQLSDEELAQVEKDISENKPLTGQGYQIGSTAAASRALNRLPAGSITTTIRYEVRRRGASWAARPCTQDSDCSSLRMICGINNQGERVCEGQNQPIDFRCEDSDECAEGLTCLRDNVRGFELCLPPVPLGWACNVDGECATGICGINNAGERVCEALNQGLVDSRCERNSECAEAEGLLCRYASRSGFNACLPHIPSGDRCGGGSYGEVEDAECVTGLCGVNNEGVAVCELPDQSDGSGCVRDIECASDLCGLSRIDTYDAGFQNTCESPNQPPGSVCWGHRECAPRSCTHDGTFTAGVCR